MNTESAKCRACCGSNLEVFLDLGQTPLADRLLTEADLAKEEPIFPLEVAFCHDCGLMQILETVQPEQLFCDKYPYYSSFSDYLLKHSRDNVCDLISKRGLDQNNFVIELASNDGYLLKNYVEKGVSVLGIDPAEGPARAAEKVGVPTLNAFFSNDLAQLLVKQGKQADVIHANNVLAHVADTNDFVEGMRTALKDDGIIVIEVPYAKDLIDHCEFDTIYHEHLCYFSVTALYNLFRCHSLYINDIRHLSIHGGSLRLYVEKTKNPGVEVKRYLDMENEQGVDHIKYYSDFSERVSQIKSSLLSMLKQLKNDGYRIAAYGAAAKGSTLINYVGIGADLIEYVVDRNIHKQDRYMPGMHLPIFAPEKLMEDRPDYVLILPWNVTKEIVEQQAGYLENGGQFIIPIPEPKVLSL